MFVKENTALQIFSPGVMEFHSTSKLTRPFIDLPRSQQDGDSRRRTHAKNLEFNHQHVEI